MQPVKCKGFSRLYKPVSITNQTGADNNSLSVWMVLRFHSKTTTTTTIETTTTTTTTIEKQVFHF